MKKIIIGFFIVLSFVFTVENAAIVDGEPISFKEFDAMFMEAVKEYKKSLLLKDSESLGFSELEEMKYSVLDALIENKVFTNYKKKKNIVVTEAEITQKLKGIESSYPNKNEFWRTMQSQGIKLSQLREGIEKQLLKDKVIDNVFPGYNKVSTKDIVQYLKKNILYINPIEYNITILVTDNSTYLDALKSVEINTQNWDGLGLNKENSAYSLSIMDEDLPQNVQNMIELMDMHKFTDVVPLDSVNYFTVRLNRIGNLNAMNVQELNETARQSLIIEKRTRLTEKWIAEQKEKGKIVINFKIFPNYYHRDNAMPNNKERALIKS